MRIWTEIPPFLNRKTLFLHLFSGAEKSVEWAVQFFVGIRVGSSGRKFLRRVAAEEGVNHDIFSAVWKQNPPGSECQSESSLVVRTGEAQALGVNIACAQLNTAELRNIGTSLFKNKIRPVWSIFWKNDFPELIGYLITLTEVPKNESKNHNGLHRVQTKKLQHKEKQEEHSRQNGNEQVLQILQETHSS